MNSPKLYSCVLVDDDRTSLSLLKNYINQIPKLKMLGSFDSAAEAITYVRNADDEIDFLFLDIVMDISGIDVAQILRDKVKYIIFITGYDGFALKAFNVGGDQYLTKPVQFSKFLETINQVLRRNNVQVNRK
ncbi:MULTISPECIES: LytTR family DNA-binding domain-containing protein [unclassified Pedobacter]|uniref:LytR/AlgR family response regulator transcription factor n=1 Tax=unclassified Pedobacter TaxID=2628915 RepID=UPI001E2B48EE|nr:MULTISPECIES: response regulator [unclassified Pedobacter]